MNMNANQVNSLSGKFATDALIDGYKSDILDTLKELLAIRSIETERVGVYPFGKEIGICLENTLEKGKQLGFEVQNLDHYVGYIEAGSGDQLIGVLTHLDIVPEGDPANWSHAPYDGIIHEGKLFGRGALDDKGPAIATLFAMKALKEAGYPFKKRIRLILGTNEESLSLCAKHYVESGAEIPQYCFTPDADFPVIHGEKGIIVMELKKSFQNKTTACCCGGKVPVSLTVKGGDRFNMVPESAVAKLATSDKEDSSALYGALKAAAESFNAVPDHTGMLTVENAADAIVISAKGVSAHGSTPEVGKNAVSYLMVFLSDFFAKTADFKLENCDAAQILKFYNDTIGTDYYGQRFDLGFSDELSGNLIFNLGVFAMDEEGFRAEINIRYPITTNHTDVEAAIEGICKRYDLSLDMTEHKAPIYFEKDHPLVQSLLNVYNGFYNTKHEPITIGGGTYARSMPNTVAFGPLHPGQEDCIHQKDEFIGVDHLMDLTKLHARAIVALDLL